MEKPTLVSKKQLDLSALQQEINQLRQDNSELRKKIDELSNVTVTPEEIICMEQISVLKGKSSVDELTLEETKKLDTYVKILSTIRSTKRDGKNPAENLATEDLLEKVFE